jgi:hypothetical protein
MVHFDNPVHTQKIIQHSIVIAAPDFIKPQGYYFYRQHAFASGINRAHLMGNRPSTHQVI